MRCAVVCATRTTGYSTETLFTPQLIEDDPLTVIVQFHGRRLRCRDAEHAEPAGNIVPSEGGDPLGAGIIVWNVVRHTPGFGFFPQRRGFHLAGHTVLLS